MHRYRRLFAAACAAGLLVALLPGARAAVSIYMEPEDLASRATVVVEASVSRSAAGYDPQSGTFATYVTLEVERVHRGPNRLERVVLREPGGRWGDLVHEIDAVPLYEPGERVLVFLEPAPDGALRTRGMFFGKFRLDGRGVTRELGGQGRILGAPPGDVESLALHDVLAPVYTTAPRAGTAQREREAGAAASAQRRLLPPEYSRLVWEEAAATPHDAEFETGDSPAHSHLALIPSGADAQSRFVPLSSANPTRWRQSDSGGTVSVNIERARNPLGDGAAAVDEMLRAMQAWNDVPESRLRLVPGNTDYDWTGMRTKSPTALYTGTNVILFGDPYEEISDPTNCAGVLAVGGYWRTTALTSAVNNVDFHGAVQFYVIFNDGFECVLSNPDDLAEVATHELGHGLGFGHSTSWDSIMRSTAYRNRGPRLGDDDRDAAHCHYPHKLSLGTPNGGEVWEVGSSRTIEWSTTFESGPDAGSVDLEYSADGGAWTAIVKGTPNDGSHTWVVPPEAAGDGVRVRVLRPLRVGDTAAVYPDACSDDASDGPFRVPLPLLSAGSVPDGGGQAAGLRVEPQPAGLVRLAWSVSCSADATDYAVYAGDLDALRAGIWDPQPESCSTAGATTTEVLAGPGNRYYLIVPRAGAIEGFAGRGGASFDPRPEIPAACAPRETAPVCG